MKTRNKHFPLHTPWLPKPCGSGRYRRWLADAGSLTQRLRDCCAAFAVQRVQQKWDYPQADEAQLLGMRRHERAWLREVFLTCADTPVVFAHSVLPRRSLCGAWRGLGRLGARPLGEALFDNPVVVRTPLAFRKLAPEHALYRRALQHSDMRPAYLWARRSVFMLDQAAIMVTEVFLPGVLEL